MRDFIIGQRPPVVSSVNSDIQHFKMYELVLTDVFVPVQPTGKLLDGPQIVVRCLDADSPLGLPLAFFPCSLLREPIFDFHRFDFVGP